MQAILIAGPTASGKSALALALAAKLGGVSRDDAPSNIVAWRLRPEQLVPAMEYLRREAPVKFRRFEFCAGIDNRPRGAGYFTALKNASPLGTPSPVTVSHPGAVWMVWPA